jgi:glycosyltransferase involved in cell wall biosynthesis
MPMMSSIWERTDLVQKPDTSNRDGAIDTTGGIKYVSLHEASGYGNAARRYIRGLMKTGIPLTWTPMVPGRGWGLGYQPFLGEMAADDDLYLVCNRSIEYDTVILHTVPEYYPLWKEREPGKRIVGYTVWETTCIPNHWGELLNAVDLLLVPCEWNREVFRECGVTTPIEVVPHTLQEKTRSLNTLPWDILEDDFVFYTIGTWTARKAIPDVIRCYLNAFTSRDNTLLVIKTSNKDFTQRRWMQYLRRPWKISQKIAASYTDPARMLIITDSLTEAEIACLHQRGDCFVSLSHSEGWGLGAFDAAGRGKPIVITGYGGHLDFLPEELAYLVDYRMVPVIDRQGSASYSVNQAWASPDLGHASRLLREVFLDRREAHAKGRELSEYVRRRFHEEMVIQKFLEALKGR